MKTETFKGTVESAYGKVLPSVVSFTGSFEAVESVTEIEKPDTSSADYILDSMAKSLVKMHGIAYADAFKLVKAQSDAAASLKG